VAVGTATITATSEGRSGTAAVTVDAPVVASATAVQGDGQTGVAGTTLPVALVVRVLDTRGNPMPNVPVAWTVTEGGGSAAPDAPATGTAGLASAAWTLGPAPGANRLRVNADGLLEGVDFTATGTGEIVASVEITPDNTRLEAIGAMATLKARVVGQSGQELPDAAITWRSLDPAIATVDESGTVTARDNGSTQIAARSGGQESAAAVVVQQRVVTIVLSPETATLGPGGELRLVATGSDANGVLVAGATFTWETSDANVAAVDETGLVRAGSTGTATVTARADGASGSATVTVQEISPIAVRVEVRPKKLNLHPHQSDRLDARAFGADGKPLKGRRATWRVSDTNVATVSADGVVTGVRGGKALVVAQIDGASDDAQVEVK